MRILLEPPQLPHILSRLEVLFRKRSTTCAAVKRGNPCGERIKRKSTRYLEELEKILEESNEFRPDSDPLEALFRAIHCANHRRKGTSYFQRCLGEWALSVSHVRGSSLRTALLNAEPSRAALPDGRENDDRLDDESNPISETSSTPILTPAINSSSDRPDLYPRLRDDPPPENWASYRVVDHISDDTGANTQGGIREERAEFPSTPAPNVVPATPPSTPRSGEQRVELHSQAPPGEPSSHTTARIRHPIERNLPATVRSESRLRSGRKQKRASWNRPTEIARNGTDIDNPLRALIGKNLKPDMGFVEIFIKKENEEKSLPLIKIGSTKDTAGTDKRRSSIERQCDIELLPVAGYRTIPVKNPERVEKLLHTILRYQQEDFTCGGRSCKAVKHREYFRVSIETVIEVVEWACDFMNKEPYLPNGELKEYLRRKLDPKVFPYAAKDETVDQHKKRLQRLKRWIEQTEIEHTETEHTEPEPRIEDLDAHRYLLVNATVFTILLYLRAIALDTFVFGLWWIIFWEFSKNLRWNLESVVSFTVMLSKFCPVTFSYLDDRKPFWPGRGIPKSSNFERWLI